MVHKVFMAIPFDSGKSPFSRDFKIPDDIKGHKIYVRTMDTNNLNPPPETNKIGMARELLAKEFMESDCDILLFIDSDIICTGKDLIPLIENQKESCMGQYPYRKWWDINDITKQRHKFPPKIRSLRWWGHNGCTAIKRSVFEKLNPPYFRYKNDNVIWKREDQNFFKNCREKGMCIYTFPNVQVGHQCRKTGKIYRFTNYNKDISVE